MLKRARKPLSGRKNHRTVPTRSGARCAEKSAPPTRKTPVSASLLEHADEVGEEVAGHEVVVHDVAEEEVRRRKIGEIFLHIS